MNAATGQADERHASEQELLQRCMQNDQAAWQRLYSLYRREAWSVFYRLLGAGGDDLEDLVQIAFVQVFRSLGAFEGRSRFSTWLYRICVHVAMDHLRMKKRRREQADDRLADRADGAGDDTPADPSRQLERKQTRERLQKALAKIGQAKRQVLILHDLLEVPGPEIAAMMRVPQATVRTRLYHARRQLAGLLGRP